LQIIHATQLYGDFKGSRVNYTISPAKQSINAQNDGERVKLFSNRKELVDQQRSAQSVRYEWMKMKTQTHL